ncbi:hypothetical protein [Parapedobacter sp. 10938]|uniref:hypothetical protein n=1 Tax=Parapedobacter flavus TaxID=3110225 RepID=UPI002DB9FB4B|nr:hypothetical protein [Parapedobacter sp. 10938]MEC3878966.1 hypothetical protein [Parapedobacter sp. 10938]
MMKWNPYDGNINRFGVKRVLFFVAALICLLAVGVDDTESSGQERGVEVVNVGSKLELMINGFLIDSYYGDVKHKLHHPQSQNIAIVHDSPWEQGRGTYHTIFKDGDVYRMYYSAGKSFICYAESQDGVHFRKPDLGIVDFDGAGTNNIVWKGGPISHNLTPFKDTNPNCPPERRYKAIGGVDTSGVFALVSADGIQWSKLSDQAVLTDGWFDSQNTVFWDSTRGHYRMYYRDWHRQSPARKVRGIVTDRIYRGIKTAISADFTNWAEARWLEYNNAPNGDHLLEHTHLYTNSIKPYYRAPHIYLGFPVRYVERAFGASSRQLPNAERHEQHMRRIGRENALTEGALIASRNGTTFDYWSEAFIRPGLRNNNWVYGDNYVAWHAVETMSGLSDQIQELSLYATENSGTRKPKQLRRYTLRIDGFVSLNASLVGGGIVTKPIRFDGVRLIINYASSAVGGLRVEIQNSEGKPISGYTLSDCDEIYGDQLDRTVTWNGSEDVADLSNKPIRLRFSLADADLYSFVFLE